MVSRIGSDMPVKLGEFAYIVKPHLHTAPHYYARMPRRPALKDVLGANIGALRRENDQSQPDVVATAGRAGFKVGQTTVGRVERAVHAADIDTIEAIAHGLGVDPWQLLVPKLEPKALPHIGEESLPADEQQLLRDYRAANHTWKLIVRLMARLDHQEQPEFTEGVNMILAQVFGREAVPNARVEETYGPTPARVAHEPPAGYRKPKIG